MMEEKKDRIFYIEAYEKFKKIDDGQPTRQLGAILGVDGTTITGWRRGRTPYRESRIDPAKFQKVLRMHNMNMQTRDIAEATGLSINQVTKYRRKIRGKSIIKGALDAESVAFARRLLEDGASYSEVGRTVDRHPNIIRKMFPGLGWDLEQRAAFVSIMRMEKSYVSNSVPEDKKRHAYNLHKSGLSLTAAAKAAGIHPNTLMKYANEQKQVR